jgi:hypothetical protein
VFLTLKKSLGRVSLRCCIFFAALVLLCSRGHRRDTAIMSTNMDPEKHSFDPEGDKKISDPVADAIRNGSLDKKILEHSHDADDAMKAFQESQGQIIEIDAATNKRLLRRIDWNLMPVCIQH